MVLLAAIALMSTAAQAQDVVGDWTGVLNAGGAQLSLSLHITKAANGSLHATLDSLDQGAMGIPVQSVTVKGAKLALDIPAVHGSYEGTVGADGDSIHGTLTQVLSLPLDFKRAEAKPAPTAAAPSPIDGAWLGSLDAGAIKLRVAFHLHNMSDGLHATMDVTVHGVEGQEEAKKSCCKTKFGLVSCRAAR